MPTRDELFWPCIAVLAIMLGSMLYGAWLQRRVAPSMRDVPWRLRLAVACCLVSLGALLVLHTWLYLTPHEDQINRGRPAYTIEQYENGDVDTRVHALNDLYRFNVENRQVILDAIDDPSSRVSKIAMHLAIELGIADAWPKVEQIASNEDSELQEHAQLMLRVHDSPAPERPQPSD